MDQNSGFILDGVYMQTLVSEYLASDKILKLSKEITTSANQNFLINGSFGSHTFLLLTALFRKSGKSFFCVFDSEEQATIAFNDLSNFLTPKELLWFPASNEKQKKLKKYAIDRNSVLKYLQKKEKQTCIISYSKAISEPCISPVDIESHQYTINKGDLLGMEFALEFLVEYNFERVDFVSEPGEYSVRGGILDVYSFSNDHPFRIEFFGEEINSIRTFDIYDQLSTKQLETCAILPDLSKIELNISYTDIIHLLPESTVIVLNRRSDIIDQIIYLNEQTVNSVPIQSIIKEINKRTSIDFNPSKKGDNQSEYNWNILPQPPFHKQFDYLFDELKKNEHEKIKPFILFNHPNQKQRLDTIFEAMEKDIEYHSLIGNLHTGFIDKHTGIACYTDHQIFNRHHKVEKRENRTEERSKIAFKELHSLKKGDYISHIDHGIGEFGGLQKIDVQGKQQEAIKIIYQNRDILYLSVHSIHKISKYRGGDGKPPKLNKLGSPAWKTAKSKTKRKVKQLAFNLIEMYAKRKIRKGFSFSPDTYLQHELEASFLYEDTPDQAKATKDVKVDMERATPMDRLICGDVGFGKTEIAIRATFKAVADNKQVVLLVPTTILAFQHYQTFSQRFKDFPISVDYMNRFRTEKDKKGILEKLENGHLDLVIGTHALVNKKTKFKDLGLLIVDEEHKFGVNIKEKLKTFRTEVDSLTLTATPIPRTLQFSLLSARDLSIIRTPPPNRVPIHTETIRFSQHRIQESLEDELARGGQVFFVHNRIENIQEVATFIENLIPNIRVAVGHGQMDGSTLEKRLVDFVSGLFDVFVTTTIVESGLDVPNANTMFINDAHRFGLADLHQLRGRVGRSNKKAYCFLITPPSISITGEAKKRIQAIEQFSELGSGFNISMKDLEIRGAGDLLGAEQSGFISEIGFDTYQKILNEAIQELRENEFKDLFEDTQSDDLLDSAELTIETDLELLFPNEYIRQVEERLELYQQIPKIKNHEELNAFEKNLIDRFGSLPYQSKELLKSVQLRWIGKRNWVEKMVLKKEILLVYFKTSRAFYESKEFANLLSYLSTNPKHIQFKEKPSKKENEPNTMCLHIEQIKSISEAIEAFSRINNYTPSNMKSKIREHLKK